MLKLPSEMIGDQSKESDDWRNCWIFAVVSWGLLFICGFIAVFRAWSLAGQGKIEGIAEEIVIFTVPVVFVIVSNLLVGLYALCNKKIRN